MPLLPLSKSNPLRWASIWFMCSPESDSIYSEFLIFFLDLIVLEEAFRPELVRFIPLWFEEEPKLGERLLLVIPPTDHIAFPSPSSSASMDFTGIPGDSYIVSKSASVRL